MDETRILYQLPDGSIRMVIPAPGVAIEDVVSVDVPPEAVAHTVATVSALPPLDKYVSAWVGDLTTQPISITINPVKKAEIDRADAEVELEEWFRDATHEGYEVEPGFRLGMLPEDVTLLTGLFVLAKEAATMQLPLPAVIDRNGVPHQLESIQAMTELMLAYGQARAELSAEYAARKAALAEQAT